MRVELNEQAHYEYAYRLTVQIWHLNYSGHVGHDAILQMVWEARVNLLKDIGFTELDLGEPHTGIIMRDLAVTFHSEGFLFDEVLIETHTGSITGNSFRLYHRLTKKEGLLALVETGFSCYNYRLHKTACVPEAFLKSLEVRKFNSSQPAGQLISRL